MAHEFDGPIFIVGMPRSGTKLMRALLNQHPRISLTLAESHFIPYFRRKFGDPAPFRCREDLKRFIRHLRRTAYFSTMTKAGYALDESTFLAQADPTLWSSIIEGVFRQFAVGKPGSGVIWGDKTPGYIHHIAFLKKLFPAAKFLHMVRDPRDYCLSVRKSFGKSVYRAAARWREGIERAHRHGVRLGADYMEVRYERLLEDPVSTMSQVAAFLGVAYDDALVDLKSAPEDLGDAQGRSGILRTNKGKYRAQLSFREIERIEEIVCEAAKSLGYDLENEVAPRPLGSLTRVVLKLHDGMASLRHHIGAERRLARGAARLLRHYTMSSWREASRS